jgi:hypothetical protein
MGDRKEDWEGDLTDSTNYGWGAEIGVILRWEDMRKILEEAEYPIIGLVKQFLMEERELDFIHPITGTDSVANMEVFSHLLETEVWPEHLVAMMVQAIHEIARKAIPFLDQIADLDKEVTHTRGMFGTPAIKVPVPSHPGLGTPEYLEWVEKEYEKANMQLVALKDRAGSVEEVDDLMEWLAHLEFEWEEWPVQMAEREYYEAMDEDEKKQEEWKKPWISRPEDGPTLFDDV